MAGGWLTPPLMVPGGLGVDADLPPVYDLGEIVGGSPPLRVLGPKIAQVPMLPRFIDGRPAVSEAAFEEVQSMVGRRKPFRVPYGQGGS
jgi:hypothetical protein